MKVIIIGRDHTCDVVINDGLVSRHHCQIVELDGGDYRVVDLGSSNGTYVNGVRCEGETRLNPTDEVRIGNTVLPWREYCNIGTPEPLRIDDVEAPYMPENAIEAPNEPAPSFKPLRENRSFWKVFLLTLVTLGIYGIFVWSHISREINTIATPHDGRKTMHYCLMLFLLSWLTLGIFPLIWNSMLASRIKNELQRRNIGYSFGPGTYWGWGFFGALLLGIGPLIYLSKLLKAMNQLSHDYNLKHE